MCIRQISAGSAPHSFGLSSMADSAAQFMLTALRTASIVIGAIALLNAITTGNPIAFLITAVCIIAGIALFSSDDSSFIGIPPVVVIERAPRAPWYHSFIPSFPSYSQSYAPPLPSHHISHIHNSAALPSSYSSQPSSWFSGFSSPFAPTSYDMASRGTLRSRSYESNTALPSFHSSYAPSYEGAVRSSFSVPTADLAQRGTLRSRG